MNMLTVQNAAHDVTVSFLLEVHRYRLSVYVLSRLPYWTTVKIAFNDV